MFNPLILTIYYIVSKQQAIMQFASYPQTGFQFGTMLGPLVEPLTGKVYVMNTFPSSSGLFMFQEVKQTAPESTSQYSIPFQMPTPKPTTMTRKPHVASQSEYPGALPNDTVDSYLARMERILG